MLRLLGSEGEEFRLGVRGYEFPEIADATDKWDFNWLIVSGEVSCPRGRWQFRDPCLLTFEVEALADWLRDVQAPGSQRELSFVEPNLRLEHVEETGDATLLVAFSQESSPPWATEQERYGGGYELCFPLRLNDVSAASAAVESMLAKWPIRKWPEAG